MSNDTYAYIIFKQIVIVIIQFFCYNIFVVTKVIRIQVEQLHKIFKLCGTPSDDYWKKLKLSTTFRPPHSYKPNLREAFRDYPRTALGLLMVLLSLDPTYRGSASSALQNEVTT